MQYLSPLTNLKGLNLSCNNLNKNYENKKNFSSSIKHLLLLTKLNYLDLAWNQLDDINVEPLSLFTNLIKLDLSSNQFSDASIKYLKQLSNLEELDIRYNHFSSNRARHFIEYMDFINQTFVRNISIIGSY
ncbi:MAG: hypothetical protein ACRYGR_07560 [Janthinobacterium lividum]